MDFPTFGRPIRAYQSFNVMTKELRATEVLQMDFVSNVSHEFPVLMGNMDIQIIKSRRRTVSIEVHTDIKHFHQFHHLSRLIIITVTTEKSLLSTVKSASQVV